MKSDLGIKQQLKMGEQWRERALRPALLTRGNVKASHQGYRVFRAERSQGDSHPRRSCCPGWAQSPHQQPYFPSVCWQHRPSLEPAGGIQAHFAPIPMTIWNIEHWAIVGSVLKMRPMCLLEENWFSKTHLDEWQARLARCRISWLRMRQMPRGVPELLHCALTRDLYIRWKNSSGGEF